MTSTASNNLDSGASDALRLEDFLGDWCDSRGHYVHVKWAQQGNTAGELDVQLSRNRYSRPIRLNVKALGQGKYQCGHFELKLEESSVEKVVWGDLKNNGKTSVWERGVRKDFSRSHSRSPRKSFSHCGCLLNGKVALRCIDHAPRSVLHDISTPGAWAPPAEVPEINTKLSEVVSAAPPDQASEISTEKSDVDRLCEAYDESVSNAKLPQPDAVLQAEASRIMQKIDKTIAHGADEPHIPPLVPVMLDKAETSQSLTVSKDSSRDPRIRRGVVASTGGA
jgi:hypothetical protein